MEDCSAPSHVSSRLTNRRGFERRADPQPAAQRPVTMLSCGTAAALLLIFLCGSCFLFWMPAPALAASSATTCPTANLPATPTSGSPADLNSIKINEVLTNPKKDWNCDGKINGNDQWIELINLGGSDDSLFGLQLCCNTNNAAILLPSTDRIAANSFLVIFPNSAIKLSPSASGTLELEDSQGNAIDTVNYPALGPDQSYIRDSNGQWSISNTPTPGAPNTNGNNPTPTSTKRSGGSGGGGSDAPTATPIPIGSVFIPTDTPNLAFQSTGNTASSGGNGGGSALLPSWLKILLLALMGIGLLGVVVWYIRSWGKESESDG